MTDQLLGDNGKGKKQADSDVFAVPEQKKIEKLNQLATDKLAEIVRRNTAGEKLWQGYSPEEIGAAKDLLAKSTPELVR